MWCTITALNTVTTLLTAVPPSPKPATNSLRIDRFLRPFTLKAVQELLGKTGTVTSFWMDNIKTHCYVSVSQYLSSDSVIRLYDININYMGTGFKIMINLLWMCGGPCLRMV